jgi:hypothetical protein
MSCYSIHLSHYIVFSKLQNAFKEAVANRDLARTQEMENMAAVMSPFSLSPERSHVARAASFQSVETETPSGSFLGWLAAPWSTPKTTPTKKRAFVASDSKPAARPRRTAPIPPILEEHSDGEDVQDSVASGKNGNEDEEEDDAELDEDVPDEGADLPAFHLPAFDEE